jgi:hypothetical protein
MEFARFGATASAIVLKAVTSMTMEIKDLHAREAGKVVTKSFNDKPMTLQEKRVFGLNIRKLEPKDRDA